MKKLLVFLLLSLALAGNLFAQSTTVRELWRGKFIQESPMPWEGEMELFFRYDAAEDFPQKLAGIISWPGLNKARTKIEGVRTEESIRFKETACLESNCSTVVLGGVYEAVFENLHSEIRGKASLPTMGLSGNFKLKRVLSKE